MLAKIAVADYMASKVIFVTADTDVYQAIKKLLDHKITSMPVLDEHGKLAGVFSELDCMKVAIEAAYNQSMGGKVEEFMTKEPYVVNADASLVDIAQKFQQTLLRSFPVLQDGELVGMISRIDVLRAVAAMR